jgi:hypothetical protein
VKHAPHLSKQAKLVKLADKLYNLRDLIRDPVPGWYVLLSLSLCQAFRCVNDLRSEGQ